MLNQNNDTITAISTPEGSGAIAIIRISGPEAINIADQFFKGKVQLAQAVARRVYLGNFYFLNTHSDQEPSKLYDQVVVTVFKSPQSYTTEDLVEINCHGSRFIAERILETLVSAGARLAEPGEFTFRAFINGRIDLSQAEAIADLIKSESDLEIKNSLQQLEGYFSDNLKTLRSELVEIISLLELELDFSEEDIEFVQRKRILKMINDVENEVQRYLQSFDRAKILREGAKVVLVGKPNVGKSSLLNVLLKENRAIVTPIPGTTRDVLEEQVTINGMRFRILDTAGICNTTNPVELEGIRRTKELMKEADILVIVQDGSEPFDQDDDSVLRELENYIDAKSCVFVINKEDKPLKLQTEFVMGKFEKQKMLHVSAIKNTGISELGAYLSELAGATNTDSNGGFLVTNIRHKKSLTEALKAIQSARSTIKQEFSGEFIVSDLREASEYLGEIIGEITSEEVLNNIFANFCIGK